MLSRKRIILGLDYKSLILICLVNMRGIGDNYEIIFVNFQKQACLYAFLFDFLCLFYHNPKKLPGTLNYGPNYTPTKNTMEPPDFYSYSLYSPPTQRMTRSNSRNDILLGTVVKGGFHYL